MKSTGSLRAGAGRAHIHSLVGAGVWVLGAAAFALVLLLAFSPQGTASAQEAMVTICHQGTTRQVPLSQLATYLRTPGTYVGACQGQSGSSGQGGPSANFNGDNHDDDDDGPDCGPNTVSRNGRCEDPCSGPNPASWCRTDDDDCDNDGKGDKTGIRSAGLRHDRCRVDDDDDCDKDGRGDHTGRPGVSFRHGRCFDDDRDCDHNGRGDKFGFEGRFRDDDCKVIVIVKEQAPSPPPTTIVVQQQPPVIIQQPAPQPVIIQQPAPAPQPVIIQQAAPAPTAVLGVTAAQPQTTIRPPSTGDAGLADAGGRSRPGAAGAVALATLLIAGLSGLSIVCSRRARRV